MPFVVPFASTSPAEARSRAGENPVDHFLPEFIFDTVEALYAREERDRRGGALPLLVAEVEWLDPATYPGIVPGTVPFRVLRILETT